MCVKNNTHTRSLPLWSGLRLNHFSRGKGDSKGMKIQPSFYPVILLHMSPTFGNCHHTFITTGMFGYRVLTPVPDSIQNNSGNSPIISTLDSFNRFLGIEEHLNFGENPKLSFYNSKIALVFISLRIEKFQPFACSCAHCTTITHHTAMKMTKPYVCCVNFRLGREGLPLPSYKSFSTGKTKVSRGSFLFGGVSYWNLRCSRKILRLLLPVCAWSI